MKYILGIDQGGSKTHVLLADEEGHILGMGQSYGAVHSDSGVEYAVQAMKEAWEQALAGSGLHLKDVTYVVGGLTGIDWDYEADLLENALREHVPSAEVKVVNDSIIAMKAATSKDKCAILCAGSGLNCAIQNGNESFVYGFYIPDEHQGGWSLGKTAVQAVMDSYMGFLEKTTLTDRLLHFFKVNSVDELLYKRVKKEISDAQYRQIPPILVREACNKDKVACNIWEDYGRTIASYVTVGVKRLNMAEDDVDVVLSGSIFKCAYEGFQNTVKEEIRSKLPGVNIIAAKFEPVVGAVIMGLQQLHGELPEAVCENIRESSRRYPLRRMEEQENGKTL